MIITIKTGRKIADELRMARVNSVMGQLKVNHDMIYDSLRTTGEYTYTDVYVSNYVDVNYASVCTVRVRITRIYIYANISVPLSGFQCVMCTLIIFVLCTEEKAASAIQRWFRSIQFLQNFMRTFLKRKSQMTLVSHTSETRALSKFSSRRSSITAESMPYSSQFSNSHTPKTNPLNFSKVSSRRSSSAHTDTELHSQISSSRTSARTSTRMTTSAHAFNKVSTASFSAALAENLSRCCSAASSSAKMLQDAQDNAAVVIQKRSRGIQDRKFVLQMLQDMHWKRENSLTKKAFESKWVFVVCVRVCMRVSVQKTRTTRLSREPS